MELDEYVSRLVREAPEPTTRGRVLGHISERSGIPVSTLRAIDKGYRLTHLPKMRALSAATGGAVTIDDLCSRAS